MAEVHGNRTRAVTNEIGRLRAPLERFWRCALFCLLTVVVITGCNPDGNDLSVPNKAWWIKDYPYPEDDPTIDEVVQLTVKIRFTGQPTVLCGEHGERLACSRRDGCIDITAQRTQDGFVTCIQGILGHEIYHQLHYVRPDLFSDPDEW